MGKLEPDCQVQVPPPSCVTLGKSLNLSGLQRPPSEPTPEGEGKTDTCERPGTCRVRASVAVNLVAIAGPEITMVDSSISQVRRLKPRVGNDLPKVSRFSINLTKLCVGASQSGSQISPSPGSLLEGRALLTRHLFPPEGEKAPGPPARLGLAPSTPSQPYPITGCSTMARGSSRSSDTRILREVPLRRVTSMRSVPVSVQ